MADLSKLTMKELLAMLAEPDTPEDLASAEAELRDAPIISDDDEVTVDIVNKRKDKGKAKG